MQLGGRGTLQPLWGGVKALLKEALSLGVGGRSTVRGSLQPGGWGTCQGWGHCWTGMGALLYGSSQPGRAVQALLKEAHPGAGDVGALRKSSQFGGVGALPREAHSLEGNGSTVRGSSGPRN